LPENLNNLIISKKSRWYFLKTVSILLIFSFVLQEFSYADPDSLREITAALPPKKIELKLPVSIGIVEDAWQSSPQFVIARSAISDRGNPFCRKLAKLTHLAI
jgi:hypothetical protein